MAPDPDPDPDQRTETLPEGFHRDELPTPVRTSLELLLPTLDARLDRLVFAAAPDGGHDVLVDAAWHAEDRPGPGRRVVHSIAFLHRPGLAIPEFECRDRGGPLDGLGRAIHRLINSPEVVRTGIVAFDDRFLCRTSSPTVVAAMLADDRARSVEHLDSPLHLIAADDGVIASRRRLDDGVVGLRERDFTMSDPARFDLLADALETVVPWLDHLRGRIPESPPDRPELEHIRIAGVMPHAAESRTAVTEEAIRRLLDQSPPRSRVPRSIRRRVLRGPRTALWMLATAATGLWVGAVPGLPPFGTPAGLGAVLLAGLAAAATIATGWYWRHERSRARLLRDGRMARAMVESVEATRLEVNEDRIHRVRLRLESGALVATRVDSATAAIAHGHRIHRIPTCVLQDPTRADRILWPDGWRGRPPRKT